MSTKQIPKGWRFNSADFSVRASGQETAVGSVLLVRSPTERARWHAMPEELQDDPKGPQLYARGYGWTFENALDNAIKAAVKAKPIPQETDDE